MEEAVRHTSAHSSRSPHMQLLNGRLLNCNRQVKRGVVEAGMVGYRFNTIGVSDAISMGTDGMSFSLQSRDLIADSIETVRVGGLAWGVAGGPGRDQGLASF